jgi:hypothetical protein
VPAELEMEKRARDVEKQVRDGFMGFRDIFIYLLNAEAVRTHWRKYLKRKESLDVLERLRTMHPLLEKDDIPNPTMTHLIPAMKALLDGREVWCVEWFYEGRRMVKPSDIYKDRYLGVCQGKASSRIADMIGFCKWDSGLKLWIESLYRPGQVIYCEGAAYRFDSQEKKNQKVRMLSHIYDFDHVVTVTIVT